MIETSTVYSKPDGAFSVKPLDSKSESPASTAPPRVRQWFPETLLWRPELITDQQGQASIDVELADSITTWQLTASAITADGQLGSIQRPIRVFQPFFVDFNLPVALTRGDEASVPVVVYNYLDRPQTVELTLAEQPELQLLGAATQTLELAAGEVRSTHYRLQAKQVGQITLEIHASGSGVADAVKRQLEIVPDGRRVEQLASGTLHDTFSLDLQRPEEAIPGSQKTLLKIYPSRFSQVVEGLDGIFQRPSGCFEQTSSTTYPNLLALDYLKRTGKSAPQVELRAREYVHLGYQRLLTFEVAGGGFDWFGSPPGKLTLTAYGLQEFNDMTHVQDVDPALIERTRNWLAAQQNADGSWSPRDSLMHEDPASNRSEQLAALSSTAYVALALFDGPGLQWQRSQTYNFLVQAEPQTIDDPYVLALVARALRKLSPTDRTHLAYLARLHELKQASPDGKVVWWDLPQDRRTTFFGSGRSGNVEATAMAALAMLEANAHRSDADSALAWLVQQKDSHGTWHTTQATVLALKALLAAADGPKHDLKPRVVHVAIDGQPVRQIEISAEQADVMQQIDLTAAIPIGNHRMTITDRGDSMPGYQIASRYYLPQELIENRHKDAATDSQLSISLKFDRTELPQGDRLAVSAAAVNRRAIVAPMVLLDLPIPPGFSAELADFEALMSSGKIDKYQVTQRSVIVYLRELQPKVPLELNYHLRATMPVKARVRPALISHYYDPDVQAESAPAELTVTAER